jgi:hypothetical protein
MPINVPEPVTVATAALLLLHTPPETLSVNVLVAPTHIGEVPVIVPALAEGLTVTTNVAFCVPQLLVTV